MNEESNKPNYEQIYQEYRQQGELQATQEQLTNQSTDGKESIVAVRKNADGDIIAIQTSAGRELDYVTAVNEAKAGALAQVDVFHRYGRDILRSEPDGVQSNNLDNLPTF
ncbi:DUF3892 domain-containing protein [Paenibacillus sp. WQ 127069]|uniref:DUF3892 domain-containing protein n=1 Tax=Paenibacillus baimaensis TaxID=2982185 RepID=A0ABT2UUM9_9BACL|nr:DUF3892 domain-containing protein [Paenibacillus sp. WQ 127069]MCU6797726.1 DUF3892 domain-containing protein [Paenibacillus sp. WQ 127069]